MKRIDRVLLGKRKPGQLFNLVQRKELLRSYLNNSQLTEDELIRLSNSLGLTQFCVKDYFRSRNKKPRSELVEEYTKLLEGGELRCYSIFKYDFTLYPYFSASVKTIEELISKPL